MKIASESREYSDDQGNVIKGVFHLNNSKIIFGGRDNFVFFNDVILNNCVPYLRNSKSLLYIEKKIKYRICNNLYYQNNVIASLETA